MADMYTFELTDNNFKIIVHDEPGPFNTWYSEPRASCLVFKTGHVSLTDEGINCKGEGQSMNDTVLKLIGASWDSEVGDEGEVLWVLHTNCRQATWTLIEKV